jgi:hypothetical protein
MLLSNFSYCRCLVIPAKAGIQGPQTRAYGPLGPRLRGGDGTVLGGL